MSKTRHTFLTIGLTLLSIGMYIHYHSFDGFNGYAVLLPFSAFFCALLLYLRIRRDRLIIEEARSKQAKAAQRPVAPMQSHPASHGLFVPPSNEEK